MELKFDGNLILNIMLVTLKQDFHIVPLNFICLSDLHITQNLQKKKIRSSEAKEAMRTGILRKSVNVGVKILAL